MLKSEDGEIVLSKYKQLYLKFEKIIYPLRRKQAKQCIQDFLSESAEALLKFHEIGFSHLDVRLENIGFRVIDGTIKAVLLISRS